MKWKYPLPSIWPYTGNGRNGFTLMLVQVERILFSAVGYSVSLKTMSYINFRILKCKLWCNVFYIQYLLLNMTELGIWFWTDIVHHVVCIPDSLSMLFGVKLSSSPSVSVLHPWYSAWNVFIFKHSFLPQFNMVNISSGFTNGLTTCVKPSSVQYNCCLKDHTSTDALLPNQLGSPHYETQDEFGTDAPSLHLPLRIPTSLWVPIAEAIWSHPGVTVAPRGAVILAK